MAQVRQLLQVGGPLFGRGLANAGAATTATAASQRSHKRWQSSSVSAGDYDLVVVGGGIVGAASAREILLRHPTLKVAILEKEPKLAFHQSGHNSGVIHAGIYYKPGTLKARLCVEGLNLAYKYLDEHKIPYKKCGKLIVATDEKEVKLLEDLQQRGIANKVPDLKMIEGDAIREIEPFCQGVKALHSPHTGIVDWALVTEHYGQDFKKAGGRIYLDYNVKKFSETKEGSADYPVTIHGSKPGQLVRTKNVLTCGGLQSDLLAEKTGCPKDPRIVPFRGEYLLLSKEKQHMVNGNIYPVPDPRFPFLGVHFTPRMDGSIWLGPNAVLALKREGYSWGDINLFELFDALRYPGFLKMASKYIGFGVSEMSKSAFINLQIKALQKYIPDITEYDIQRGPAGVRAQAMDLQGNLVDDFVFDRGVGSGALAKRVLHCRNAPSPGATSSLAIAKMIADKIEGEFSIGK
ncbi:L-2-hydroxyglutarate dehydrogenase, mitochondrial [Drosophila guanche]|uniref:L-2-hydroxyglutarate dehydrogenase, mitochondrial n=1 Tax=Drosophila guanche TaxID=7266 RepID=A0A3B0K332_DROGU|nr:L-2-hydroxyglutarate dehydrogenase, mitochondrial [Drosophila guanche]SPP79421.1 blast:L-2-hydroxyglutarate dehydrogenase%2C mitochondrial [Drosophila guanche]